MRDRPRIVLKPGRFDHVFKEVLGYRSDGEIAEAAGYTDRTVRRARAGQLGDVFIAGTLKLLELRAGELAKHGIGAGFDELFELEEWAA